MKKTIFSVATLTAMGVSGVSVHAEEVTVKNGDTLWGIANKRGTTVADLKDKNNLSSNLIHPGDVLSLSAKVEKVSQNNTYTVKAGDTLWAIGNEFGVAYVDIMRANNLSSDLIFPGQKLTLDVEVVPVVSENVSDTVAAEEVVSENVVEEIVQPEVVEEVAEVVTEEVQEIAQVDGAYVVQSGDTLFSIARTTGVDVETIKALNSLTNDLIMPDQVLVLTGEVPVKEVEVVEEVAEVVTEEVAEEVVETPVVEEPVIEETVSEVQEPVEVVEEVDNSAQVEAEKAEAARVAAEQEAARRAAERQEAARQEAARQEAARQAQLEQQRVAKEQKAAQERAERERIAAEKAEAARAAQPAPTVGNGNAYNVALNLSKGKSYVYGANSAYAVDCSSFAQQFMASYKGINIPRTTYGQRDAGTRVSNPQPGDLVFFNNYSHVGVYVGNGMMVDALNPSEGVGLRAVSYVHGYVDGYYRY